MGTGSVENANGLPPLPPPAAANAPAPKHVSIVVLSRGEDDDFLWLYESIEGEVNRFAELNADAGNDLVFDTESHVKKCLESANILNMDRWALRCVISQTTNTAAKPAFTIVVVIKKTGNTYSAAFAVIDNTAIAAVETLEAQGPKNDILRASWEVVQRAFTPKPKETKEAPPEAEPAPLDVELVPSPPPDESAFTRVDAEVKTSPRPSRWKWPVIFGGLGAAVAIAAGVLGIYAKRAESDSHDAAERDDAFAKYDDAKKFALSANILFGASVVLGGTAVYSWFTSSSPRPLSDTSQ